jgi:hypothetical protein
MECPNTTKHAEETFGQVFGNAPPHSFNERTPVLVMVMDISHQGLESYMMYAEHF